MFQFHSRDGPSDESFNGVDVRHFLGGGERERVATFLRTPCAPDAVDMIFGILRPVIIDPVRHAFHVNPVRRVNELSPDFVLSGGDQIYDAGYAEHSRAVRLFENYRDAISDLRCPIYHVMGNHDHFGHGRLAHYAGHADYGKQLFLDQIGGGRRYRSFTRQNWHFILLDTSHFHGARFQAQVDDEQFEWLRRELQSLRRGTQTVVVTHVPLLTRLNSPLKGRVEFPVRRLSVARAKKVRKLLHENNVRLVLQGHIHTVEQLRLHNTWYVNSGAVCGRWWQGSFVHCPMGFTVVSVKNDLLHWRFENLQPPNS